MKIHTTHRITMFNRMIILFLVAVLFSCTFQSEQADLIVHNGRIYTMNESSDVVEAMAIRDGRIIETGPERQILNKYRADKYVDCGKHPVYPGFIDAHCHFLAYGFTLSEASLIGTTSFEEVLTVLKAHAAAILMAGSLAADGIRTTGARRRITKAFRIIRY